MRLDIPEPTTPEEWAASRCEESWQNGRSAPERCEARASRRCDRCQRRVCSVHWRDDGFQEGALELCVSCWQARHRW